MRKEAGIPGEGRNVNKTVLGRIKVKGDPYFQFLPTF
jgi:hypothetical protein